MRRLQRLLSHSNKTMIVTIASLAGAAIAQTGDEL